MFSFIIFSVARGVDNPQFKLISLKRISTACFSKKSFLHMLFFFFLVMRSFNEKFVLSLQWKAIFFSSKTGILAG